MIVFIFFNFLRAIFSTFLSSTQTQSPNVLQYCKRGIDVVIIIFQKHYRTSFVKYQQKFKSRSQKLLKLGQNKRLLKILVRPKPTSQQVPIRNHFIFILGFLSTYIILMDFSNYLNPFFTAPPLFEMPFYGYHHFNYPPPPMIPFGPPQENVEGVKTQSTCKELDQKKLVQALQKFHFDQIHQKKTHWTLEEDKLLEKLVEIQKLEWREIPKHFEGRTQNMCYSRYRRILMSAKERNWNKQDEAQLLELINRYGEKWKFISSKMTKFSSKQVRQRYLNYLRPNINKEDFTLEQDLKICEYVVSHGNHWRRMEVILEGRPEGLIKGRYYGRLQKIIESCLINKRQS